MNRPVKQDIYHHYIYYNHIVLYMSLRGHYSFQPKRHRDHLIFNNNKNKADGKKCRLHI